jgi:RNA polymerase primary sigma factor
MAKENLARAVEVCDPDESEASEVYESLDADQAQQIGQAGLSQSKVELVLVEAREHSGAQLVFVHNDKPKVIKRYSDKPKSLFNPESIQGMPSSYDMIMRDIKKYPLLTAKQEIELAKRIERGDLEAKEKMVLSNMRLVAYQARRFQFFGLSKDDLVSEGTMGLIRATEKFDYRKGFKFSTYAVNWIKQGCQRGITIRARTIRVPRHVEQLWKEIDTVQIMFVKEKLREATADELCYLLEIDEDIMDTALGMRNTLDSLDEPVTVNGEGRTMADVIGGSDETVDEIIQSEETKEFNARLVNDDGQIPSQHEMELRRELLERRFIEHHTYQQIADDYEHLDRARVMNIIKETVANLAGKEQEIRELIAPIA